MNSYYKSSALNGWRPKIGDKVVAVALEGDMAVYTGNVWTEVSWNDEKQIYEAVYPGPETRITKRLDNGNLLTYSTEDYDLTEGEVGEVVSLLSETRQKELNFVKVKFKGKTGYVRMSYIEPLGVEDVK